MIKNTKIQARLQLTSFFSGAATMILELAGSRLVAPFFGTSLIVWTALIGIIMSSLCFGNWFGGFLSDKRPEGKLLGRILFMAAIIIALTAFLSNWILTEIQDLRLNLYASSVLTALSLFAPSSLLLGMVQPFVARLAISEVDNSGQIIGRLSALNSAGSILGTFMGGFVLISLFPSQVILMLVASMVALLSVLVYTGAWRKIISFLLFLAVSGATFAANEFGLPFAPVGEHIETAYNHISVAESIDRRNGRRVRIMITDPDAAQSLMYLDSPNELVSDYAKFYDLAFHFKPDTKRVLMLGGGGYSVPKYILANYKDVSLDVVELDPGVTQAARKYFALQDNPKMTIYHEDARTFLNRLGRGNYDKYDAILMDTFSSAIVIPFQLTTVEAGRLLRSMLKPDGVLIVNIISSIYGQKSGVFHGLYKAFGSSFDTMMIFPVNASEAKYSRALQNIILVGMNAKDASVPTVSPKYANLLSHQWLEEFVPDPSVPSFSDSFAPVERYTLLQ
ncbi:MAG: fused MFS/spermidine synthase [Synergistaceae bacterium]|nr:fused MFS/spermidine synthase [Synergistaceae bacterium]